MTTRNAILSKIRNIVSKDDDTARKKAVTARLRDTPTGLIPARGQIDTNARAELFHEKVNAVHATIERLENMDQLPEAVSQFLRARNLPPKFRRSADPRLSSVDWSNAPHLEISEGPSDGSDEVGLAHAHAGLAETGTLVMTSGPQSPTTLNFLPETQIVVLRKSDIAGGFEETFSGLKDSYGAGEMPRTVNFITGPSLSGDIEQTLLLGAHGPRNLHILLVD